MAFLDMLLILACLIGGLAIMHGLHHAGFHGLSALAVTLGILWLIVSFLSTVISTVTHGWLTFTAATGDALPAVFGALVLGLLIFLVWRIWLHWRARQYFDF
jgi:hypothetical protein